MIKKIFKIIGLTLLFLVLFTASIWGYGFVRNIYFPGKDLTLAEIQHEVLDQVVEVPDVKPQDNAYLYIEKIDTLLSEEDIEIISEQRKKVSLGEYDNQEILAVLKKYENILRLMERAFSKPAYLSKKYSVSDEFDTPSILPVMNLVYLKVYTDFEAGNYDLAIKNLVTFNEFLSIKMQDGHASFLISVEINAAISIMSELNKMIIKNSKIFDHQELKRLSESLSSINDLTELYEIGYKSDYGFFRETFDNTRIINESVPFSFKTNQSIELVQDFFMFPVRQNRNCSHIGEIQEEYEEFFYSFFMNNEPNILSFIIAPFVMDNYLGETLVSTSLVNFESYNEEKCEVDLNTRFQAINLAIIAYEKKYNEYPETLEKLVPEYLKEVPLSNFTKKPILYNSIDKTLYQTEGNKLEYQILY